MVQLRSRTSRGRLDPLLPPAAYWRSVRRAQHYSFASATPRQPATSLSCYIQIGDQPRRIAIRAAFASPRVWQVFSMRLASFLQILAGFCQANPNFYLAVLGNFKGLAAKYLQNRVFRFSPNFCPRGGRNFCARDRRWRPRRRTRARSSMSNSGSAVYHES